MQNWTIWPYLTLTSVGHHGLGLLHCHLPQAAPLTSPAGSPPPPPASAQLSLPGVFCVPRLLGSAVSPCYSGLSTNADSSGEAPHPHLGSMVCSEPTAWCVLCLDTEPWESLFQEVEGRCFPPAPVWDSTCVLPGGVMESGSQIKVHAPAPHPHL